MMGSDRMRRERRRRERKKKIRNPKGSLAFARVQENQEKGLVLGSHQVTRDYNIVADGWAGASNPHPHPMPPPTHTYT